MKKVNLALTGCGLWGANFLRIAKQHPECNLLAISDIEADRLQKVNSELNVPTSVTDYKMLLNEASIDAVIVATPVISHYEIVKYFLSKGKHVLCEKPLTITSAQSLELHKIADDKRVVLMIGHVFLYNQGIIFTREKLNDNFLGDIIYMHFQRTGLGPIRQDVNVLYDLASHDISILLYFLGKLPNAVSASGKSHVQSEKEDVAFLQLEYDNVIANIHVSWIDPHKERRITVVGSKKMLVFNDVSVSEKVRIYV